MDNFDLTKYLAEGQLNENKFDVATTEKIAQAVADAFTAEDNLDLKYIITPGTEESSFDLDVKRGPNTPDKDSRGQDIENYLGDYAGGSFYIKDGVVYNAAMRNAPVANVTPEGEVEMISAEDSRAAIGMVDGEKTDYMERRREMSDYVEEGEEKKSNKMKKSELKEMIRTAFLSEASIEETLVDADQDMADAILNALGGKAAFEAVVRAMSTDDAQIYLGGIMRDYDIDPTLGAMMEAEGDEEEVDVEDTEEVDVDVEDTDGDDIDVTDNAEVEMTGDKKEIQDNLQAALEAAKALGDQKLIDQIGNSITFFTRTHIVGKEEVTEASKIELTPGNLNKANVAVKNPATMAQVLVGFYNQIQDREQMDYTKNQKLKMALSYLKKLEDQADKGDSSDTKDDVAEVEENLNESLNRMQKLAGLIK